MNRALNQTSSSSVQATSVAVWDLFLRIGHWTLVAAFAVAHLSAEEESGSPNALHVWGGYLIGTIVVLRIFWGFVGPEHARFRDFICGPVATVGYLVDLISGRARRYLGHSPAGGAMVVALLFCLAATVVTGILAEGEAAKRPLALDRPTIVIVAQAAGASEEDGVGNEKTAVGELHGALADITLALVILHVLGVGLASVAHRENLVAAMVTGRKRTAE